MDKFFKISERGSNVKTEIIAGLTTFFAMAYIVITNPNQITSFSTDGALGQIWNSVYIASILVAVIGTLLMALYAKMPFAQACGMGLNSFFFVSFILPALITGGDLVEGYQAGLVIILVSGIIFLACIFIAPIAAIIPAAATSAALIYVGILMLMGLKNINFEDMDQVVPVGIMLIGMPVSSSIGHAIGLGLISYTIIKVLSGKFKEVSPLTYIISLIFILKFFVAA